jgi:putative protease
VNKKPELLVTAGSTEELTRLIDAGADAVNIGEQTYGLRLPGDFSLDQIKTAVSYAHERGSKIYVSVNGILENHALDGLPDYLSALKKMNVDAVVFGDPAVIMALRQAGIQMDLHWNTEMTSTNYSTAQFWKAKGATRVVLPRELNLEEVLEFKQKADMEVQVQVHGMTNIYHSKRNLVRNYLDHVGQDELNTLDIDRRMVLVEHERREEKYPVYEDANGTHIMSSEDLCMLEDLHELLEGQLDSLKIEGLMKSIEYNETVVKAYRQAIDAYYADPAQYEFDPDWLEAIEVLQDPERELTFGFFYKEQVY